MIKTRFAAIWPILLAVAFCCRTDAALGQVPSAEFPVNGVDYRFKRMVTRRPVNDAADSGRIKLVSYVYEPLHDNRGDVVIVLHGSTGGMASSPNEPLNVRGFPIDFLLGRGLTVVVPLRRGRAESTGTYVEECPYYPGRCSLADNRLLAESGLADAIASTDAVLDDVLVKLNPRDGKVVLVGTFARRLPGARFRGAPPRPGSRRHRRFGRMAFHRGRVARQRERRTPPVSPVGAGRCRQPIRRPDAVGVRRPRSFLSGPDHAPVLQRLQVGRRRRPIPFYRRPPVRERPHAGTRPLGRRCGEIPREIRPLGPSLAGVPRTLLGWPGLHPEQRCRTAKS